MPALLALIPWRLVGIGVLLALLAAGIWGAYHAYKSTVAENTSLRIQLAAAVESARANAAAVEEIRRTAERNMQAVANSLETARAARVDAARKKGVLKDVPVANDEAASAVLSRAIQLLRLGAAAAPGGAGGEGEGTRTAPDPDP